MLNFAEQTGSGAVMFVWSFLTCQYSLLPIKYIRFNKIITSYLILLLHQLVSNLHMIVTFYRAMKNNMYYFTTQAPGGLTTGNWLSSRLLSCGRVLSCARKTNACMKNNMILFPCKTSGWLAMGTWFSSRVLPCAHNKNMTKFWSRTRMMPMIIKKDTTLRVCDEWTHLQRGRWWFLFLI